MSSSWVKIRLHIENQLPRLLITALIVISPVWWCGVVVYFNHLEEATPYLTPPSQKIICVGTLYLKLYVYFIQV